MLLDGIPIGHARDVVRNPARLLLRIGLGLILRRQQTGIIEKRTKQIIDNAARLGGHAHHEVVAVEVVKEKALEYTRLFTHWFGERHQRRRCTHVVDTLRRNLGDARARGGNQIDNQRIDDAADRLVDQAPATHLRERGLRLTAVDRPQRHVFQLLQRDQAGAQAVVDIVIVVRNLIRQVGELRF